MLRAPRSLKTQATAPPLGAAVRRSGKGALITCSMVNPDCCAATEGGTAPSASAAARTVEGFRRVVMTPKATVSLNPWRCPILAADAQEDRRGPDPERIV